MPIHLTDEMRAALAADPGQPVEILDAASGATYVLVAKSALADLALAELRERVARGFDLAADKTNQPVPLDAKFAALVGDTQFTHINELASLLDIPAQELSTELHRAIEEADRADMLAKATPVKPASGTKD